jgi:hypothetical protein
VFLAKIKSRVINGSAFDSYLNDIFTPSHEDATKSAIVVILVRIVKILED